MSTWLWTLVVSASLLATYIVGFYDGRRWGGHDEPDEITKA
jgi:uncharacterized protein YneF (UPF0154 family)